VKTRTEQEQSSSSVTPSNTATVPDIPAQTATPQAPAPEQTAPAPVTPQATPDVSQQPAPEQPQNTPQ